MKSYREIALKYHFKINNDISSIIMNNIDTGEDYYTFLELCTLSRFGVPVLEKEILTRKELDIFLNKLGKEVYFDYLFSKINLCYDNIKSRYKNG